MADLRVDSDELSINLSRSEKALALRKQPLVIRHDQITAAMLTNDPWIWIRGIRAPGTHIPLTLALGTWKHHDGKDFLLIKGRAGRLAVILDLEDHEFDRVILTTTRAVDLIRALRVSPPGE